MQRSTSIKFRQSAFTLIELMITIAVLSILLFVGSSLTRSWVDRGNVDNAASAFKNATLQARAAALRNTNNQPTTHAAVSVCYDPTNQLILVVRAAYLATDGCSANLTNSSLQNYILQSTPISNGINLKVNGSNFNCLAFNSAGMTVDSKYATNSCSNVSNLKIDIEKNNEKAQFQVN